MPCLVHKISVAPGPYDNRARPRHSSIQPSAIARGKRKLQVPTPACSYLGVEWFKGQAGRRDSTTREQAEHGGFSDLDPRTSQVSQGSQPSSGQGQGHSANLKWARRPDQQAATSDGQPSARQARRGEAQQPAQQPRPSATAQGLRLRPVGDSLVAAAQSRAAMLRLQLASTGAAGSSKGVLTATSPSPLHAGLCSV